MGFGNRKHRIKTRRLIQLNLNETEFSNLYKFITVLKAQINTNDFFFPKKFSCQSLKKRSLLIANCLTNLFRKLNKDQKNFIIEIRKEILCKRKDRFWSLFSFAINFMFELKMSFKKTWK